MSEQKISQEHLAIKIENEKPKEKIPKSKKSSFAKIATITAMIIFVLLVFIAIYLIFCQVTGHVPFYGNFAMLKIQTGSMEDAIPAGSYIYVKRIDAKDVRVGDVITFYSKDPAIFDKPNTHRVMDIQTENGKFVFITKGDNNPVNDSYKVSEESLIGIFVKILPFMTQVGKILTNKYAFIIIIMIPITSMAYFSIKDVVDNIKEKNTPPLTREEKIAAEVEKLKAQAKAAENISVNESPKRVPNEMTSEPKSKTKCENSIKLSKNDEKIEKNSQNKNQTNENKKTKANGKNHNGGKNKPKK